MCAINRVSVYISLSILVNLCGLMFLIAASMNNYNVNKNAVNTMCIVVPVLLAGMGFVLATGDEESQNAQLNIARHTFSCTMRRVRRDCPIPSQNCVTLTPYSPNADVGFPT
jgi:hypothetical protein